MGARNLSLLYKGERKGIVFSASGPLIGDLIVLETGADVLAQVAQESGPAVAPKSGT